MRLSRAKQVFFTIGCALFILLAEQLVSTPFVRLPSLAPCGALHAGTLAAMLCCLVLPLPHALAATAAAVSLACFFSEEQGAMLAALAIYLLIVVCVSWLARGAVVSREAMVAACVISAGLWLGGWLLYGAVRVGLSAALAALPANLLHISLTLLLFAVLSPWLRKLSRAF